jgi:hypothetical protein
LPTVFVSRPMSATLLLPTDSIAWQSERGENLGKSAARGVP